VRLSRSFGPALLFVIGACETKKEPSPGVTHYDTIPGHAEVQLTFHCGEPVVRDEGVGELQIGAPVDSISARCLVLRDTTAIGAEGMPARKLAVFLPPDTVEAEVVNSRIWRLSIVSPHFRTTDSLGVGTPLSRLLKLRNPRGMTGEGKFFVASPDHCGMSFRLANAGPGAQRGDLDQAGLNRLPKSATVSEILVFGCHVAPGKAGGE
jgi:hypothetical protein